MTILLDTCAWIFRQQKPDELTFDAKTAIEEASRSGKIYVSATSVWEIAMKAAKGKLELGMEVGAWVDAASADVDVIALDPAVLMASWALPPWNHPDPFDRIIVAEARRLGVPLITSDNSIRGWPEVQTIW